MKRVALALAMLLVLPLALRSLEARAEESPLDPDNASAVVDEAMDGGKNAFCKDPKLPLSETARGLCPAASEIKDCEGFAKACKDLDDEEKARREPKSYTPPPPKTPPSKGPASPPASSPSVNVGAGVGAFAQFLMWALIAGVIIAILIPIIRALAKSRRDMKVAEKVSQTKPEENAKAPEPAPVVIGDEEALLRRAEEHARRGEYEIALQLYLAAALRALDKRGAIRLSKDRTNGEYVRFCKEQPARGPLREIVNEVDRAQFGREQPTEASVTRAAQRAVALVRALPVMMLALLFALGCGGSGSGPRPTKGGEGRDPAGIELLTEVLTKQGMKTEPLGSSLASIPLPDPAAIADTPAVLIDTERTALDDDTRAHLLSWVDAGGFLILAGYSRSWPQDLEANRGAATGEIEVGNAKTETVVLPPPPSEDEEEDDVETDSRYRYRYRKPPPKPETTTRTVEKNRTAKVEFHSSLVWTKDSPRTVAWYKGDNAAYAAKVTRGKGTIMGIATNELLTNAAIARPGNAAAVVALFVHVDRKSVKIALADDGIAPPSNPFSAMQNAGLGMGMWHALAFVIVLFLAVGIRLARPKPVPPPARRAFTEHVEATGALYARTGVASHALASYARYADERLRAKMPRGTTDVAAFLSSRSKVDYATCEQVWSRAKNTRPNDPPRGDELEVLKQLSQIYTAAMSAESR